MIHSYPGQLFGGKTTSDAPQPCFPKSCLHAELENLLRKIMPSLNLVNSRPWRCRVFSDSVRSLLLVSMSSSPIVASFLLFTLSSDGIWMLPLSSTSPLPALPVLLLPLSLLGSQLLVQDIIIIIAIIITIIIDISPARARQKACFAPGTSLGSGNRGSTPGSVYIDWCMDQNIYWLMSGSVYDWFLEK